MIFVARGLGRLAVELFLEPGAALPKASTRHDHYEAITRADTLMMALLRLWQVREVVAHWVETGAWWTSAGARAVLGTLTSSGNFFNRMFSTFSNPDLASLLGNLLLVLAADGLVRPVGTARDGGRPVAMCLLLATDHADEVGRRLEGLWVAGTHHRALDEQSVDAARIFDRVGQAAPGLEIKRQRAGAEMNVEVEFYGENPIGIELPQSLTFDARAVGTRSASQSVFVRNPAAGAWTAMNAWRVVEDLR